MNRIILIFFFLVLASCANPVVPTGGPKDNQAPYITHIQQTHENNENVLNIFFNEQVITGDPKKTILFNPATNVSITTQVRNKSIKISIPDTVPIDSNNYLQLMNSWVKDLNEKNSAPDISFLPIKSLDTIIEPKQLITGTILCDNPLKNAQNSIYLNTEFLSKNLSGLYFTRNTESGTFTIPNINNNSLSKILLLNDQNFNHHIDSGEYYYLSETPYLLDSNKIILKINPGFYQSIPIAKNLGNYTIITGLKGRSIKHEAFYSYNLDTGFVYNRSKTIKNLYFTCSDGSNIQISSDKLDLDNVVTPVAYVPSTKQLILHSTYPLIPDVKDTVALSSKDGQSILSNYWTQGFNKIIIDKVPNNTSSLYFSPSNAIKYRDTSILDSLKIPINLSSIETGKVIVQRKENDTCSYILYLKHKESFIPYLFQENQNSINIEFWTGSYDLYVVKDSDKNGTYTLSDISTGKTEEETYVYKNTAIKNNIDNILIIPLFLNDKAIQHIGE